MKKTNSAEGSEEGETEQQRLVSQYLNLKMNSEPHQLANESQEEQTEQQRIIIKLQNNGRGSEFNFCKGGRKKPEFDRTWTPPLPDFTFRIKFPT